MRIPLDLIAGTLVIALVLSACGDEDDVGFFTAPGPPASSGTNNDADCAGDVTGPVVETISASPHRLWPPDHRMVPVAVRTDAGDACDPLDIRIVHVQSDEPVNGLGDGDTAPDWQITGPLALRLRAERAGTGNGRVYTIRVRYTDALGNESFEHVEVEVPHDSSG
jgi:hypothetical protein